MTITGDRPPDRPDTSARDRCQQPAHDRHGPAGPAPLAELAPVAGRRWCPRWWLWRWGARAGGPSWRQEPSLRRSSRSRLRLRQPGTRPAVRPATREALICKHVTGSRTCSLEAACGRRGGRHVHHVKEYLGGTHR